MIFKWGWCTICETWFVRCPKCSNNCCNGTFGKVDGKECDTCPLCYQYQELAYKFNNFFKKEEFMLSTINSEYDKHDNILEEDK